MDVQDDDLVVRSFRRLEIDQLGKLEDDTALQGNCKFTFLNFKHLLVMEILSK